MSSPSPSPDDDDQDQAAVGGVGDLGPVVEPDAFGNALSSGEESVATPFPGRGSSLLAKSPLPTAFPGRGSSLRTHHRCRHRQVFVDRVMPVNPRS